MALYFAYSSSLFHLVIDKHKYGTSNNPEESLQTFLSTGTTSVNLKMAYQIRAIGHHDTHIRGELGHSKSFQRFNTKKNILHFRRLSIYHFLLHSVNDNTILVYLN